MTQEIEEQTDGQIDRQSGGLKHVNKQEYLHCMESDMALEMKAETIQIALTLSSYHDNQPPELGGKSHERSGRREEERPACPGFTVFQVLHVSSHCTQVTSVMQWQLHAQCKRRNN